MRSFGRKGKVRMATGTRGVEKAVKLATAILFLLTTGAFASPPEAVPRRIVSLAPSTTETLFALGVGDRLVGVTRYCDHPPAAEAIDKVGGFVDPNYEKIVALRPDLVVLLTSHRDARMELAKLRIPTLTVPHETLADIHEAIRRIGAALHRSEAAQALIEELQRRTAEVKRAVLGRSRPRVLICIGRDTASGELAAMYMAGRRGFHHEILTAAGGENVIYDEISPYPQLSAEGVLRLDPEVIVDLVSHIRPETKSPEEIRRQWARLRPVTAVLRGEVHVMVGHQALRPGPRYIEFLEELARRLHPEAFRAEDGGG